MSAEKVIQFSDYQSMPIGSQAAQNGENLSSQGDSENLEKSLGNMGLQGDPDSPLWENSEEPDKTSNSENLHHETKVSHVSAETKVSPKPPKPSKKTKVSPKTPALAPTADPEGHKIDVVEMTFGQLKAAYHGEFQSWKNGKSRCKQKGCTWDSSWDSFKDFLLDIGPKSKPFDTLDRIDNAVKAYGPGLCRWASPTVQNNNKSGNVKIVVPLTGEVLTPKKIAQLRNVSVKTVHKWISQGYSALDLLAGKKLTPLLDLSVKLDELPVPSPAKKAPVQQLKIPKYLPPTFEDEIEQTEAEYELSLETGVETGKSRHQLYREDYDALVAWVIGHNAGLPVSPEPPQGRYWRRRYTPIVEPSPPKSKATPKPAPTYDDEYDPADCMPDPNYDPADCMPNPDDPNGGKDKPAEAKTISPTSILSKFPLKG